MECAGLRDYSQYAIVVPTRTCFNLPKPYSSSYGPYVVFFVHFNPKIATPGLLKAGFERVSRRPSLEFKAGLES